ncbi:hypothetical protein F2Q70_00005264 [Brassica cretica]|uniref:Uncharacterized protein n=1 Tax=Brassica cretica TaxID=69181 RepID=A0A8S9IXH1_BRACR|nr:hypothetical protein F2Q70_00005264 [Brassica cretica]
MWKLPRGFINPFRQAAPKVTSLSKYRARPQHIATHQNRDCRRLSSSSRNQARALVSPPPWLQLAEVFDSSFVDTNLSHRLPFFMKPPDQAPRILFSTAGSAPPWLYWSSPLKRSGGRKVVASNGGF